MEQKIGEIREILQAASVDELPAFIAAHEKDERAGASRKQGGQCQGPDLVLGRRVVL